MRREDYPMRELLLAKSWWLLIYRIWLYFLCFKDSFMRKDLFLRYSIGDLLLSFLILSLSQLRIMKRNLWCSNYFVEYWTTEILLRERGFLSNERIYKREFLVLINHLSRFYDRISIRLFPNRFQMKIWRLCIFKNVFLELLCVVNSGCARIWWSLWCFFNCIW